GVLAGDVFIHLEEVAVFLLDDVLALALDRVGEIEINAEPARADAAAFVAGFLRAARGNVARGEVAVTWIFAFEKVIAGILGDVGGIFAAVLLAFRRPHAAVIAQGF